MRTILMISLFFAGMEIVPGYSATTAPVSHESWTVLLKKHVSADGRVSYKGFKEDRPAFKKYLDLLSSVHPDDSWSKAEQMAYWINAYNAFTVELILRHYPVKSINDIKEAGKKPWDIPFIEIKGKKYTLNDIEHNILRKKFNDSRIHFAIVCASFSCPILLNEAFIAEKLDQQLITQAKQFINDPQKNELTPDAIRISKLFDWFKGDFTKKTSIQGYLNKYAAVKINSNAKISYLDYNWSLNE